MKKLCVLSRCEGQYSDEEWNGWERLDCSQELFKQSGVVDRLAECKLSTGGHLALELIDLFVEGSESGVSALSDYEVCLS